MKLSCCLTETVNAFEIGLCFEKRNQKKVLKKTVNWKKRHPYQNIFSYKKKKTCRPTIVIFFKRKKMDKILII